MSEWGQKMTRNRLSGAKLNVLHVIAPVQFGGGESLLVNLLRERSINVTESVALLYQSFEFLGELQKIEVPAFALSSKSLGHGVPRGVVIRELARLPTLVVKLAAVVRGQGIDILHAHGFPAILAAVIVGAIRNIPVIYTHHSIRSEAAAGERIVLGRFYAACAHRTGVSDVVSESMMREFPRAGSFVTIPNCIGEVFFATSLERQKSTEKGRVTFVMPARFVGAKNQDLVIKALAEMFPEERAAICIWFAGDGEKRAEVEKLARELGVADSVRFLGAVPYAEMPRVIGSANYGLFPCENEGFGIGAVECLALGKPVVAVDTELTRKIIGSGGVLVPRWRLADGLRQILLNGESKIGSARQVAEKYRPNVIKGEYIKLYRRACGVHLD